MSLPWLVRRWLGFPDPPRPTEPIGPDAIAVPPEPVRSPEEVAVRADPTDGAALDAYATLLERGNDPRGALIRAMRRGEPAGPSVLSDPALMGPLLHLDGAEVVWEGGLWRTVRLTNVPRPVLEQLKVVLGHPSAVALRRLEVVGDTVVDVPDGIADSDPLVLAALIARAPGGQLGTWAAAWPRLQRLETLELDGGDPQLGDVVLPALTSMAIRGRIADDALWAIARMHTPALTALSVEGSAYAGSPDADAVARITERFPFATVSVGPAEAG